MENKKNWNTQKGLIMSPSILAADFSKLGESIAAIKDAEYVHIDIMDGAFVPNISFGVPVVKSIRPLTKQIFDVHLMIEEPNRYIADFAQAGADLICVHAEACKHLDRTLQTIKEAGCKAGVALNPATPLEALRWVLKQVDMVLIMTVNPGFGGQAFLPEMLSKIRELSDMLTAYGLHEQVDIEVDGGITLSNVSQVLEAGANVIVAGSSVYKGNPSENIALFKEAFQLYTEEA